VSNSDRRLGQAWLWLCLALALHVTDEALTGFLDVYNPTVLVIRSRVPWLPLPVFEFGTWLTGLVAAVAALSFLALPAFRGRGWIRVPGYAFAILMLANATGHTAGTVFGRTVESVQVPRPMPGFYSSPFLFAAALNLLYRLRASKHARSRHSWFAHVRED
jgi:hypothetical protein